MQKTHFTLAAYFSETLVLNILNYLYKFSLSKGQIFSRKTYFRNRILSLSVITYKEKYNCESDVYWTVHHFDN